MGDMEKKNYWFALYPDSFLWVKGEKGLVYNAGTGTKVKFANEGMIADIVNELLEMEALYCVSLSQDTLEDENVKNWIHEVAAAKAGALVPKDGINRRPLTLKPVLKVQDGVDYYRWEHRQGIDGNALDNLHRLVFYINGSRYGNDLYGRQVLYPVTSTSALDGETLCSFVASGKRSFLSDILLVGNPFVYPELSLLLDSWEAVYSVKICVAVQDVVENLDAAEILSDKADLNILVSDYTSLYGLSHKSWIKNVRFTFLVASEEDYEKAMQCQAEWMIDDFEILPVYTGTNRDFFEEAIFMDEEEIQSIALSKREIFIRQALNVPNFGNLFIMPDGQVYSNRNEASVGHIQEPLHDIVYREIDEGHSWLRIRNEHPCSDCIYQWLCPSPSNYELVMGKPNLCHLHP